MSEKCCNHTYQADHPRFRKALWVALIINTLMFCTELGGSIYSGSVALIADAADFAGDAANYAISLWVLSMGMRWRARAALFKGWCMLLFGIAVLLLAGWHALDGHPPEPITMGTIAILALLANISVAIMLYSFRSGDANMRSVWLCSRNDAIGNLAVLVAAFGVLGTTSIWPDLLVAAIMGGLAISSGLSIIRHAQSELQHSH